MYLLTQPLQQLLVLLVGEAGSDTQPEPVRLQHRRPLQERSDVLLLQLRRTANDESPDSDVLGADGCATSGNFSGFAPIRDPLTRIAGGSCIPFAGNQIPTNRLSPDRTRAACSSAAADERRQRPESPVHLQRSESDEPVQPQAGSSFRRERHGLRTHHAVPRGRRAAVRHDVAERSPRARLRTHRHDTQRKCGTWVHVLVRLPLAERGPLWLPARERRPAEP